MLRLPLSGQTAVVTGGAWEEGLSAAEDLERLRRALDVNVLGAYVCMRRFAPDMVGRGTGSIVNTSTNVATQRSPRHLPYGPSKAFIEAFSLAAAEQLAGSGVRVNVVASGGQVNRRGQSGLNAQPSDWMVPLLVRLAGDPELNGRILVADRAVASAP